MGKLRAVGISAVTLCGTVAIAPAPALAATPVVVHCGQTITHSVQLASDLVDCPGEGLIIGADGITIDLRGHMIDGTATTAACPTGDFERSSGIDNRAGHSDLMIENGTVQQFQNGVGASSGTAAMSGSHLRHLLLRDNQFSGIDIGSGDAALNDNEISHNVVTGSACAFGIAISNAHANRITDNRVARNGSGILVCCGDHNAVEGNLVSHSRHDQLIACCGANANDVIRDNVVVDGEESGIVVCCAPAGQHDLITRNTISGNLHQGILLAGASDNAIVANHVVRNGDDIALDGDRNTIVRNQVSDALGCPDGCGYGVSVDGGNGNLVADNMIARTLLDGIAIRSFEPDTAANTGSVVRANTVLGAGRDGIAAATEGTGAVSGVVARSNTVIRSGHDGIHVATSSASLAGDLAIRNANLGIDAVPGVTDEGGNRAFANGNPLQCTNVVCG